MYICTYMRTRASYNCSISWTASGRKPRVPCLRRAAFARLRWEGVPSASEDVALYFLLLLLSTLPAPSSQPPWTRSRDAPFHLRADVSICVYKCHKRRHSGHSEESPHRSNLPRPSDAFQPASRPEALHGCFPRIYSPPVSAIRSGPHLIEKEPSLCLRPHRQFLEESAP
jgi:hypothetical protein